MAPIKAISAKGVAVRPKVLVVDDEAVLLEMIRDTVVPQLGCKLLSATSVSEARKIIESQPVELLVIDRNLPDGDGLTLLSILQLHQPSAQAIVITGAPTMDSAIQAMREGATDYIPKPFTARELADRAKSALARAGEASRRRKRVARLRGAVRKLNDARKMVSKKVDLLCNDLINAYSELSRQLDLVRAQEGYKHCLSQSKDLEQLLCNTMDWLLRQIGYSNIAVWLASSDDEMQLGAYMKYTIPGEPALTEAMRDGLVKLALRDNFVHLTGDAVPGALTAREMDFLNGQEILAMNCTYLAESLGAIVIFRDARTPFREDDVATLKAVCPLFAMALASIVKGHGADEADGSNDPWNAPADDAADHGLDDTNTDKPPRKKDEADWWKRGEEPPF